MATKGVPANKKSTAVAEVDEALELIIQNVGDGLGNVTTQDILIPRFQILHQKLVTRKLKVISQVISLIKLTKKHLMARQAYVSCLVNFLEIMLSGRREVKLQEKHLSIPTQHLLIL